MKERDIIEAGLKIVGFFIVVHGILGIMQYGIPVVVDLIQLPQSVAQMDSAAGMDHAQQEHLVRQTRRMASLPIAVRGGTSLIKLLLGIYLCRGGKSIVKLLSKKETSQQTGAR